MARVKCGQRKIYPVAFFSVSAFPRHVIFFLFTFIASRPMPVIEERLGQPYVVGVFRSLVLFRGVTVVESCLALYKPQCAGTAFGLRPIAVHAADSLGFCTFTITKILSTRQKPIHIVTTTFHPSVVHDDDDSLRDLVMFPIDFSYFLFQAESENCETGLERINSDQINFVCSFFLRYCVTSFEVKK